MSAMSVCRNAVDDDAIAHVHDAVEVGRGFGVVGNHDDGLAEVLVQAAKHFQNDFGVFGVKVSGGLVGEEDFGLVDDGAGDRDALLFTTGKFSGAVIEAFFDAEHPRDDLEAVRIEAVAMNVLRDGDISLGSEGRKKVEALEDESDFVTAQLGTLGVGHRGEIVAVDKNAAARSLCQTADDVKERRFAATRWPHDSDGFPGEDVEIDATERGNLDLSGMVELPEILRPENGLNGVQIGLRRIEGLMRSYFNCDSHA